MQPFVCLCTHCKQRCRKNNSSNGGIIICGAPTANIIVGVAVDVVVGVGVQHKQCVCVSGRAPPGGVDVQTRETCRVTH